MIVKKMHIVQSLTETLCVLLTCLFSGGNCVPFFPSPLKEFDLLHHSNVTSSGRCNSSGAGYTCDPNVCVGRSSTPPPQFVLTAAPPKAYCDLTVSGSPPGAVLTNGQLKLVGKASENCTVTKSLGSVANNYSLSLWTKQNCTSCDIFSLKPGSTTFSVTNNKLDVTGVTGISTLDPNTWYHIVVIQRGSTVEVYVNNDQKYNGTATMLPSGSVSVDIKTDLKSNDELSYADFRYYGVPLTDREIKLVKDGSFPGLYGEGSECRCSDVTPSLDDMDKYSLKCFGSSSPVNRLRTDSHLPVFAIDGNGLTSWITGPVTGDSWLNLDLKDIYQIDGVSIQFGVAIPKYVVLKFISSYGEIPYSNQIKSGEMQFNWTAPDVNTLTKRTALYGYLARDVRIVLTGFMNNSMKYYEVVDIRLTVRINCHGSASQINLENNCTCIDSTNTKGQNCETCKVGKYRDVEGYNCDKDCVCNTAGSLSLACQPGGQCFCKTNVDGMKCDSCKGLTFNLTASNAAGCSPCDCDSTGTRSCDTDTGTCTCKNNIQNSRCTKCKDGYYGFSKFSDGCKPCGCDFKGTNCSSSTKCTTHRCNDDTGQCLCKENVMGVQCNECKDEFYKLDYGNSKGCEGCDCNRAGSHNVTCEKDRGQCSCRNNLKHNMKCDASFDTTDLIPNFAPMSGGTMIMIKGNLFGDNANTIRTYTDQKDPKTFKLVLVSDTELKMESPAVMTTEKIVVTIQWQNVKPNTKDHDFDKEFNFEFKKDPIVKKIDEPITSFKTGGCMLTLTGEYFDSLYQPQLIAYTGGGSSVTSKHCTLTSSTLTCPTPYLVNFNGTEVHYGLLRVKNYTNLQNAFPNMAVIKLVDAPTVNSDSEMEINFPFTKSVSIKGQGFKQGCSDSDFMVKIGNEECSIKSIQDNSITCEPQQKFPGKDLEGNLVLYIGDFNATIGMVTMRSFWKTNEFIYIAAGAGAFVLLVIILIVVCCCCCRRRKKHSVPDSHSHDKILETNGDVDLLAYIEDNTTIENYGSENRYTDLGANDGQGRQSSKHIYVPLTSENNGTSKDVNEFSSLETKNSRERQNNKYTDVQLTSENSSAFHSPIQPVMSNPAHNSNKYDIGTVSTDDFLNMLDSTLRDNVQQSLSNPENIKPGVKCTKKGLQIRIINGEFQDGPFRGKQAVLKTTIKDFASFEDGKLPRWGSNGISEVLRFRDLYSDNTYFSCGMVVKNNRFYVLYPNAKRILKDHLNDKNQDFQMFNLIEMCHQAAEAMAYLSESGITHKDLAARNCVITEDNFVKVSDAAFSWDLFPDEYMYDSDRERYLPVRWLAIDSLISGFYDTSTDVWSFGVLMWEISSRALILPYPDKQNNQDIKDHVKEGFRPGQPNEVPKELYDLMTECWKKKSAARPSFKDIIKTLLSILYPDDQMLYENQEDIQLQNIPTYGNTSDNSYNNPAFQS